MSEVRSAENGEEKEKILLEFIGNQKNSGMFNNFYNIWLEDLFGEIPRIFHQNPSKNQ